MCESTSSSDTEAISPMSGYVYEGVFTILIYIFAYGGFLMAYISVTLRKMRKGLTHRLTLENNIDRITC